ncbi:MAG: multicopper oxidase domain-containing protein [Acidimicrobiia bacterium]
MKRTLGTACFVALAITACGGDSAAKLPAQLTDYAIQTPTTVNHGKVRFELDNRGSQVHEFVVVRTDKAADELPRTADKKFDEEGAGASAEVIDEVEDIDPGEKNTLTVELEPGKYLLLCNLLDHFERGMHIQLTVT